MEKIILIDPGHGGLNDGNYKTPGKQATFENTTLYEGVLNRAVAHLLNYELSIRNIKSEVIVTTEIDISLSTRAYYVNQKVLRSPTYKYFLLSVHHNAADNPDANGFECYTSKGETESDKYARELMRMFKQYHESRKARYSTVPNAKEQDFYILKNTLCPAVLTEFAFMTNPKEFKYMTTGYGVRHEVNLFADWIEECIIKAE